MGRYSDIKIEEELKNKVGQDFFGRFDHADIPGKIDFAVKRKSSSESYFLWAEAKAKPTDAAEMLAQLVLTIGKARTFTKHHPPKFLGCFDCGKIAFIEYHEMLDIFSQNDFNWNVAANRRDTKEFKQIREKISAIHASKTLVFDFAKDKKTLETFIKDNFNDYDHAAAKIQIDKNNFVNVYCRWAETVKPSINIDWEKVKKLGILDGEFYLADLLSAKNKTLFDKLSVLLNEDRYEADRHISGAGLFTSSVVEFKDGQAAHNKFWAIYERPPKDEYREYIYGRRDLLVPQDLRERKGSFFTPKIWVELSQKYIADVFGEDWQDEYHVWDCAAGTGNLLAGLTNKYNIWASTLDKEDVDVMHQRIDNGANLLKDHCFKFDFLNDDFNKLPEGLRKIIEKTPERLIIYINPPYAEADNRKGEGRSGVAVSLVHKKYSDVMGYTKREIFIQFLTRVYKEINGCKIANFATLKLLCAPNFVCFREMFRAKLKRLFVAPANTFDNVTGQFPIGFHIWDTNKKERFKKVVANVFDKNGKHIGNKTFYSYDNENFINDWVKTFRKSDLNSIATIIGVGSDFQNQRLVRFGEPNMKVPADNHNWQITANNLIESVIYFTVRKIIPAVWLNDRDQFLYPDDGWQTDKFFQSDCLTYTLFNNNISSAHGVNHWIPFTEKEVNARDSFDSHFMLSFMTGKIIQNGYSNLFEHVEDRPCIKRVFSAEAKAVFDAGRRLWKYYHEQPQANVNASYYDIREHFQGRDSKGRMNNKSADATYNELIGELRDKLKILTKKIEPKVYEYGFLRE